MREKIRSHLYEIIGTGVILTVAGSIFSLFNTFETRASAEFRYETLHQQLISIQQELSEMNRFLRENRR